MVIFVCVSCIHAFAQTAELTALTNKLKQSVVAVQSATKSYEPKIDFVEPAVIRYSYIETDQKGNHINYVYEFNLSDIDPYAVREQTQKDKINVVLAVRNKQKLVKVTKNDEVQPYDEQVEIIAKDIENARAISDIIKKAIPPAEKVMAGRLKLTGYDAMVTWLTNNVKSVDLGTKSYKQTLVKGEKPGSIKFTQVESDGKTSTEEVMVFNLADINVSSINFKITGNKFGVDFETIQRAKYISVRRNGEVKPLVNEITINTNNVDEARDLKTVLALAAPLAIEKVKADIPPLATEKEALQRIKTLTGEVASGNKQISQSFDGQCLTVFTQVEKDPKTTENNVYKFNWIDINPAASVIDVTGDRIFIDLAVNDSKKLIMHTCDDKFNGYDNEVKLFMTDIENARRVKAAVDKAVEKCKSSYKEPFGNDAASSVTWIIKNVTDVVLEDVTVKQSLEQVEPGKNNKLKYTRKELNAKGSGADEVYEFSLSDINPLTVETEVKGKWLYVSMETNFKSKIIKYYKDGKIQPYTATLEFAVNDVDKSRNMISALKKAAKALTP